MRLPICHSAHATSDQSSEGSPEGRELWLPCDVADDVHFTAKLPAKRMAADCLFTDRAGRVLVLEPPYKSTWDIPGGMVERDESPRLAAQREVREEIGLTVEPGDLLAVDWVSQAGDFTEIVAFLFDGGVLAPADIDRIVIQPTEVSRFRFVTLDEAERLLDAEQFARVAAGLKVQGTSETVYLESGIPPRST
jgi:8-oxo-dGTP pyrophosphatase MutT (NUDIX family)